MKNAAVKKMRLYVTGYCRGEYLYILSKDGLVMNHKEYSISKIKIKPKQNLNNFIVVKKTLNKKILFLKDEKNL